MNSSQTDFKVHIISAGISDFKFFEMLMLCI